MNTQKTIDNRKYIKGIRLDVYVLDENETVYNLEMQMKDKDISPRSRYYQSVIDMELILKGEPYQNLNKSYVIFICTFDLFNQGRYLYSFQNRCDQDEKLILEDGTYKLFLNTKGTMNDVNQDIKDFLTYVETSTKEVAEKSDSLLVKKIHERVEEIRSQEESEVEFMTYMEKIREEREDAREEERERMKIELCQKMLQDGVDNNAIMRYTGLTEAEILEIKKSMMLLN